MAGKPMSAAAVLLAAGMSRRFGGPKLLADLAGRPLVDHAADLIGALARDGTFARALAVVSPDSGAIEGIVRDHGLEPVVNPDPDAGLASSLRAAIAALQRCDSVPDAVMIFLADQPQVRAGTVQAILGAWRLGPEPVVRPRYSEDPGTPGHPVLVARPAWDLFEKIEGDHGLSVLLRNRPGLVRTVPIPGTNPGMDTPADLRRP